MLKNKTMTLIAGVAIAALALTGCTAEAKPEAKPTATAVEAKTVVGEKLVGEIKTLWDIPANVTGQLGSKFLAAETTLASGEVTEYALFATGEKAAAVYKPFAEICLSRAFNITPIFEGVMAPGDSSVNGLLYAGMDDGGNETVYGYANKGDVYAVAYKTYDDALGFSVGIIDEKKALATEYRGRFEKSVKPLDAVKHLVELSYNGSLESVNDNAYVFETLTKYGYGTSFGSLGKYGVTAEEVRKIFAGSYEVSDYESQLVYNFEDKNYYTIVETEDSKSLVNTATKKSTEIDKSCK